MGCRISGVKVMGSKRSGYSQCLRVLSVTGSDFAG